MLWNSTLRAARSAHQLLVAVFPFGLTKRSSGVLPVRWQTFEERDVLWASYSSDRNFELVWPNHKFNLDFVLLCFGKSVCSDVIIVVCCTSLKVKSSQELCCFWNFWWRLRNEQESCKSEIQELKQLQSSNIQQGSLGDSLQTCRNRLVETFQRLSNHTEIFKITKMCFQNSSVVVMLLFCVCSSDAVVVLLKEQLKLFFKNWEGSFGERKPSKCYCVFYV